MTGRAVFAAAWLAATGVAVTGAAGQVIKGPARSADIPPLTDEQRIGLLEQQVSTLAAQVKALQAQAARALYVQVPSEGSCEQTGTLSPNDILESARTYHAAIDKAQSNYPLGFTLPTITCSASSASH